MSTVLKDGSHLTEAKHEATYAEREGFRIVEISVAPSKDLPWHSHSNISDTFYVLEGEITVTVKDPDEQRRLLPGEPFTVGPKRQHHVLNEGYITAIFLSIQGIGEYDFVVHE